MSINKERLKRIFSLSIPIIAAMASQNVVNLIDTAMVGSLGDAALAAIGIGGFATFMFQSVLMGVSVGVQAQASRRKGEGNLETAALPLNAGLLITSIAGLVFSLILYGLIPKIYHFLNSDPDVMEVGIPYLQMRILSTMFITMNFSFRGYWNAVDMPKVYMKTLFVIHGSNIILSYILIFGKFGSPQLGVTGAGLGTSLSYLIGSIIYFYLAFKLAKPHGFFEGLPKLSNIKTLIKISIPNSLQQLFFSSGFTAMYWIIGLIGTRELAGANVLVSLMLIAVLPGLGFGIANATLVGQAMGREDPEDAYEWGIDVAKVCFVFVLILTIPLWLLSETVLGIFIHDPMTLELTLLPLRIMGFIVAIDSAGLTMMSALQGAGDTKSPMLASVVLQWLIFLPLAYLIGPMLGHGLLGVWCWFGFYRLIQTITFWYLWYRRGWVNIKV